MRSILTGKHIFFVAYGGAHIRMVIPVMQLLQLLGCRCTVLALTTAQPVMEQLGLPYIGFRHLLQQSDAEALDIGRGLISDLPTPPLNMEETIAYLGLSYAELQARFGPSRASRLYSQKQRQCFEPVNIVMRALKKYRPDMVITTSSPRAEKAALVAAKELAIPSVCLFDFFGTFNSWAYQTTLPRHIMVYSSFTRNFLISKGQPKEKIIITGDPSMDRLNDVQWLQKASAWRTQKGWQNKKIILWASNPQPKGKEALPFAIDNILTEAMRKNPDWRLITRFHPSEAPRFHHAGPDIHVSLPGEDLTPLLFACDVCLTISSTVGLEAQQIKKPVIRAQPTPDKPFAHLRSLGISFNPEALHELEKHIHGALSHTPRNDGTAPPAGSAASRIASIICTILTSSNDDTDIPALRSNWPSAFFPLP